MICCKIIADYSNKKASFTKLCELLAAKGDFLWEGGVMYFADTEGNIIEKHIKQCVKKAGYTKVFIDEYNIHDEPRESERIKGWITDKLMKIHYKNVETQSQEIFRNTKKQLEILDKEVMAMLEKQAAEAVQNNKESGQAEDKK